MTAEQQLAFLERVLAECRKAGHLGGRDRVEVETLRTIAKAFARLALHGRALDALDTALSVSKALGLDDEWAEILAQMADVKACVGRVEESLGLFEQSERLMRRLGDESGRAAVVLSRGKAHFNRGDWEQAANDYRESAEIARTARMDLAVAEALHRLAELSVRVGAIDEAIVRFGECVAIREKVGDPCEIAWAAYHLANAHADAGQWAECLDRLDQASWIAEREGLRALTADCHRGRAATLVELGDSSMAVSYCKRALERYKLIGDAQGEAHAYRVLGKAFAQREQWQMAHALFDQSKEIFKRFGNLRGDAETRRESGRVYLAQGDVGEARRSLKKARRRFRRLNAVREVEQIDQLLEHLASDG